LPAGNEPDAPACCRNICTQLANCSSGPTSARAGFWQQNRLSQFDELDDTFATSKGVVDLAWSVCYMLNPWHVREDAMFEIIRPNADRAAIACSILEGLPEWFGIPKAREEYIERAGELPMLAVSTGTEIIGFLSIENKTRVSSEIFVLGVRREWHRRGVGKCLFNAVEADLVAGGIRYLIVKTLSDKSRNAPYLLTRRFYESVGFEPIDELPELWGPDNPCLLMLKPLQTGRRG
jgi:ribosomal protein S18 acetylase RimI-like enzyme